VQQVGVEFYVIQLHGKCTAFQETLFGRGGERTRGHYWGGGQTEHNVQELFFVR